MTTVFLFCAISSSIMLFLFFVLPNLDRLAGKAAEPKQQAEVMHKRHLHKQTHVNA